MVQARAYKLADACATPVSAMGQPKRQADTCAPRLAGGRRKRMELMRQLVPGITRIAVLVDPTNAVTIESTLRDAEDAARALGGCKLTHTMQVPQRNSLAAP
jgi:hypothetical protein